MSPVTLDCSVLMDQYASSVVQHIRMMMIWYTIKMNRVELTVRYVVLDRTFRTTIPSVWNVDLVNTETAMVFVPI